MPNLSTKSFTTLISDFASAVQGRASVLVDFTIGSIPRALAETVASVVVWLESLILLLLQTTRAATSSGTDLDSWVNDYGVTRLPADAATGQVTFARFTNTEQALVPVGAIVQATNSSQQYAVTLDANNAAFSPLLGGYIIPAGVSSVTVQVKATVAGAAGNALAGSISVITQAIQYVDTVANPSDLTNGNDAESDSALRQRFIAYIASLSKATKDAIGEAILSVQVGVSYTLVENYAYDGTWTPGYFYAVVDDGSGTPDSTFLSSVSNAIDAVRAFTIRFGVFAPVIETADINMTVTVAAGFDPDAVKAQVHAALLAYIATLVLGQSLPYTRLAQVAYSASPGVINVTGVTLNSGTADLAATTQQRITAGTVVVS